MPSDTEFEIHSLLTSEQNTQQVLSSLLLNIHNSEYSYQNKIDILFFAFHTGAYKQILTLLAEWPENNFPWALLTETLSEINLSPSKKLLTAIIKSAKDNNQLHSLVLTRSTEKWGGYFKEIRKESLSQKKEDYKEKIDSLKQKLLFLKKERLFDEEITVINQLKNLSPKDSTLTFANQDFKERWARNLISNYQSQKDFTQKINANQQTSLEEESFCKHLQDQIKKIIKSNKENFVSYDLSLVFYFLGHYQNALDVIEDSNDIKDSSDIEDSSDIKDNSDIKGSSDSDSSSALHLIWLKLDLLYLSRQYIRCLELINQLIPATQDAPEAQFNANYMQALSYWKLKKKSLAINTLKGLVNVNAEYRSAHALLKSWMDA